MNMKDGLTGIAAVVDDQPVATFVKPAFFSERLSDKEQVSDKLPFDLCDTVDVPDMLFGHDQNVRRRLWINVIECDGMLIFVDQLGGYLFFNDLAEYAVRIVNHFIPSPPLPQSF